MKGYMMSHLADREQRDKKKRTIHESENVMMGWFRL